MTPAAVRIKSISLPMIPTYLKYRPIEKRHFSPGKTSNSGGMKCKYHHGYIALRNQQKEILRDRSHGSYYSFYSIEF